MVPIVSMVALSGAEGGPNVDMNYNKVHQISQYAVSTIFIMIKIIIITITRYGINKVPVHNNT